MKLGILLPYSTSGALSVGVLRFLHEMKLDRVWIIHVCHEVGKLSWMVPEMNLSRGLAGEASQGIFVNSVISLRLADGI